MRDKPTMDEQQHRLGAADRGGRGAERPEPVLIVMAHRPVDHRLGDERDGDRGNKAGGRSQNHGYPSRPVRHQVGQQPSEI